MDECACVDVWTCEHVQVKRPLIKFYDSFLVGRGADTYVSGAEMDFLFGFPCVAPTVLMNMRGSSVCSTAVITVLILQSSFCSFILQPSCCRLGSPHFAD